MSSDNIKAVAQKLLEQSREDKVDWLESPGIENRFFVTYHDSSVSITESTRFVATQYILTVHSQRGTSLESLKAGPGHEAFDILDELFEIAKRKALKADKVISDLLERLTKGAPPTTVI